MAPNAGGAFRVLRVCKGEFVRVCGHSCVHMCAQRERVYAHVQMSICVQRVCVTEAKCTLNVLSL